MRMLTLGLLVAVLTSSLPAASAVAQSDSGEVIVPGVGVMTTTQVEERIARLEKQRDDIRLAGPRAGVGITAILVPGGAMAMGAGIAANRICIFTDETVCRTPAATAGAALGAAAMIGGLVGVILTSRKLKKKKEERERLQRAINRLERSLTDPG